MYQIVNKLYLSTLIVASHRVFTNDGSTADCSGYWN